MLIRDKFFRGYKCLIITYKTAALFRIKVETS